MLWLVLRCIHQRQEAGPCVLQRSHDNTWPVLTELWNISAPKQVCYSLYTACLCVCTLLRHTAHPLFSSHQPHHHSSSTLNAPFSIHNSSKFKKRKEKKKKGKTGSLWMTAHSDTVNNTFPAGDDGVCSVLFCGRGNFFFFLVLFYPNCVF